MVGINNAHSTVMPDPGDIQASRTQYHNEQSQIIKEDNLPNKTLPYPINYYKDVQKISPYIIDPANVYQESQIKKLNRLLKL